MAKIEYGTNGYATCARCGRDANVTSAHHPELCIGCCREVVADDAAYAAYLESQGEGLRERPVKPEQAAQAAGG